MGSDHLGAQLDAPYGNTEETRIKAMWFTCRTGNRDPWEVLGLVGPEPDPVPEPLGDCPICGNRLPSHGVCRRRETCREAARERGESA